MTEIYRAIKYLVEPIKVMCQLIFSLLQTCLRRNEVNIPDKFNDWGGRGCNIFVPVLRGNGTKIVSTGDRFDQPPGQMR